MGTETMNRSSADGDATGLVPASGGTPAQADQPAETVLGSVQAVQNQGHSREDAPTVSDHGLPKRTVTEISQRIGKLVP